MKGLFSIFVVFFINLYSSQRLNDDIEFRNLNKYDSLKIENIKYLLPKSKIISVAICNRYALKRFGCIEDYKIVYLYENQPILLDEKDFNIIEEMINNGSERSTTYISKKRTYITDWHNKKFISKQLTISKDGRKIYSNESMNKAEIEDIINSK